MDSADRSQRLSNGLAAGEGELAAECLRALERGDTVVRHIGGMDAAYVHKLYARRWGLQLNVTGSKIEGYETLIPALKLYEGTTLLDQVETESCTYTAFSRSDGSILGVLKSPNLSKAV